MRASLYHSKEMVTYERDASGLRTNTMKQIDAQDASRALDKYETRLPQHVCAGFKTFLNSCRKNRDAICAFWPIGWTNAQIESQNGVIREIDRAAHGSLEFEDCAADGSVGAA